MSLSLYDEAQTLAFARQIAPLLTEGGLVFLEGTLGAGKTTFSRGLIQALGHSGAVKSPTYTLVEEYDLPSVRICHFDLYRLADPQELEFIGIREYLEQRNLCLVEWPEKGAGVLPAPDLIIDIEDLGQGRQLHFSAESDKGQRWLTAIEQHIQQWKSA